MSATSGCANPLCTCQPCGCGDDCKCGSPKLGDLERRVMNVLWARPHDSLSGRSVADELPAYAYTTVATILNRLARKGMLRREKSGSVIVYTAIVTDAARTATAMRQLLAEAADPETALVRFAELASPAEARALRRALDAPLSTQAGTRRAQGGHRASPARRATG